MQVPISLSDQKNRIQNLINFTTSLEEDIFNYNNVKDKSIVEKVEYYKLAKSSLIADLNFIKSLPDKSDSDDELLKGIIITLNKNQKQKLKTILLDLIKDKDNNK